MRKWLAVSVLLAGCALPFQFGGPSLPFTDTKQVVENANVGSFGVCPSGVQVFFVWTTHEGKVYQLWMTDSRFVAAEYAGEDVSWPTTVYWGTLSGEGVLKVSKTTPFNPDDGASPCDWLVTT